MKTEELIQGKTDQELQNLWNTISGYFDKHRAASLGSPGLNVGILALSRETERRGLVMDTNRFGEIILKSKT